MNPLDLDILLLVQSAPHLLLPYMKAVSFLGSQPALLCIAIFIMYALDYRKGVDIILLLGISSIINGIVKTSIRIPRPFEINPGIRAYSYNPTFNGYAFPSLHTQSSTVTYGTLIGIATLPGFLAIAVLLFLIASSRMYLGEHTASQTAAGIMIGIGILYLYGRLRKSPYIAAFTSLPERRFLLFSIVLSLVLTGCAVTNLIIFSDFTYSSHGENFEKLYDIFYGTGIFTGSAYGSFRFLRRFTIHEDSSIRLRIVRFLFALLLSAALIVPVHHTLFYIAYQAVTTLPQFFGTLYFSYILYITYGFLLTFIFPVIFHRIGLFRLQFNYMQ